MKKLKNFSKIKIVFRCDAALKSNVGTGHLYRCIIIANYLQKKFNIKKKHILFFIKTDNEYKISRSILKDANFNIYKINYKIKDFSLDEAKEISKIHANLLVIDRIGRVDRKFFEVIRKSFKKKIILECISKERRLFDLSINSLVIPNKKFYSDHLGFKYLILNSFKETGNMNRKKKTIFLSFGGYDHNNLSEKILSCFQNINSKFEIYIPKVYDKKEIKNIKKHKLIYYKRDEYLKFYKKCEVAIVSGGLTLYDGIILKKKIICIPQYQHQLVNAKKINKSYNIKILDKNASNFKKKFKSIFYKIYDSKLTNIKKRKSLINKKNFKNTLEMLKKIYETSVNRRTI